MTKFHSRTWDFHWLYKKMNWFQLKNWFFKNLVKFHKLIRFSCKNCCASYIVNQGHYWKALSPKILSGNRKANSKTKIKNLVKLKFTKICLNFVILKVQWMWARQSPICAHSVNCIPRCFWSNWIRSCIQLLANT